MNQSDTTHDGPLYRDKRDILCHFPKCGRTRHSGDHCQGHARQRLNGIELHPILGKSRAAPTVACSYPECDTAARSKGLCRGHSDQLARWGELRPKRVMTQQKGKFCTINECGRAARTKGMCSSHAVAVWKGREGQEGLSPCGALLPCEVPECKGYYRVARTTTKLCGRHAAFARQYGVPAARIVKLFTDPSCELCGSRDRLHIDHDHACCPSGNIGKCGDCVRGLLCQDCNHMIGNAHDTPAILIAAAAYLERAARFGLVA
jgi:hypothetical protein